MELPTTTKTVPVALKDKRDARLTMPWFASGSSYPPRPSNIIEPLINGERAFSAVHEALSNATRSIDIISWGFDPSMRLLRPNGERLGDLLKRKAGLSGANRQHPVQVRILIWKNALANFGENNLIGDGLAGSGGTALGSGVGGFASAGGGATEADAEFNDYAGKLRNSAAILHDDDAAKRYNREWFSYLPPAMEFRTRDFSFLDRKKIELDQFMQRGLSSPFRTLALSNFASHHQKIILVDYESPEHAVGFVMGHNLLRNYWDTDEHTYFSEVRHGFKPWQDLSSRVFGPVLYDLNENFTKAWKKAEGWRSKFLWNPARQVRRSEDFIAPALKRGTGTMAQICRTQPQESDKSILEIYRLATANARVYMYFENQYFRYKELAELIREVRRNLKSAGRPQDLYLFVVTNVPDNHGRTNTYEMLAALGQAQRMPAYQRDEKKQDPDAELRRIDLEGVNIHIATLMASSPPDGGACRYEPIYVHSKLLLVDDVFFTLGSANINVRSLESDSELNIACPSPDLTRQWREHLWRIHTGQAPLCDMAEEFERWRSLMKENAEDMADGLPLTAPLLDFYDDGDVPWSAFD